MLEEDGTDGHHSLETIGWMATTAGVGYAGGLLFEAVLTPTALSNVPLDVMFTAGFTIAPGVFGSIATFAGNNPGHLRQDRTTTTSAARVFIEEERCRSAPHPAPTHR